MTFARRRSVASAAVAGLATFALAGCGIPTGQAASPIAASQLPGRVVSRNPSSKVPSTDSGLVQVDVYFTSTNAYVLPEARYVKPHASLATVIGTLLLAGGPSTTERFKGIQSALSSQIHLLSSHVASNVVTANFSAGFGQLSGTQEILGVAQVVYTVAANLRTNVGVLFEIDGVPIDVPVASGALESGPVHESQYGTLLSPAASPTTALG